jgi:hypothetical protein
MAIVPRRLIIIFSFFLTLPVTYLHSSIVHDHEAFPFIVLVTMLAMALSFSQDHGGASKDDFSSELGTTANLAPFFTCLLMMVIIMPGQANIPMRSGTS